MLRGAAVRLFVRALGDGLGVDEQCMSMWA